MLVDENLGMIWQCGLQSKSQQFPGLYHKCGKQADGSDFPPLLCSLETPPGVLHPTLGFPR